MNQVDVEYLEWRQYPVLDQVDVLSKLKRSASLFVHPRKAHEAEKYLREGHPALYIGSPLVKIFQVLEKIVSGIEQVSQKERDDVPAVEKHEYI